jgi:hypothetical protein
MTSHQSSTVCIRNADSGRYLALTTTHVPNTEADAIVFKRLGVEPYTIAYIFFVVETTTWLELVRQ